MFKGQDKSGRTSCARTPARNDAVRITLLIRKKGESILIFTVSLFLRDVKAAHKTTVLFPNIEKNR